MASQPKFMTVFPLAMTVWVGVMALSACTINIGMGEDSPRSLTSEETSASNFSQQDLMFAQMMIPHHEQALEMGVLALKNSTNDDVRDLAQQIYDGQGPEIEVMQRWLDTAPASGAMSHEMPDGTMMDNGMMGPMMDTSTMAGMASEKTMAELATLTSPEFDILFLQLMIDHHEGALEMVMMIENSANEEAQALAKEIIAAQKAEIEEMTLVLTGLTSA
jgi:uncharacterized protein (DUF305 family)